MFALSNLAFAPGSLPSSLDLLAILSIKVTLLLGLAIALDLALRRRATAAVRHHLWSLALLATLVLLPLGLIAPGWSVRGISFPSLASNDRGPATGGPEARGGDPSDGSAADAGTGRSAADLPPAARGTAGSRRSNDGGFSRVTRPDGARSPAGDAPRRDAPIRLANAVLVTWAVGAAAVLASMLAGAIGISRLTRAADRVEDEAWLALASSCARRLGLDRTVELLRSDRVPVPMTWGLLHTRVLLPSAAEAWPIERRRVVMLHELAHVLRRDCLCQTVAQIACATFWFLPVMWYALRRLRVERERACDDLVLAADTRASDYAEHLLAVVRSMREPGLTAIGAVAFARPSQFEGRLLAVLDPDRARGALSPGSMVRLAIMAAVVAIPLGALKPAVPAVQAASFRSGAAPAPAEGPPSDVVRAPETRTGLVQRWVWAFSEAARRPDGKGFWVAYRIPRPNATDGFLTDNGGIDLETLDEDWPGPRLSDVLAGRSTRGPKPGAQDLHTLVLAFHFPARATRPDAVDRIRAQSVELTAVFGKQPLYWLGDVEDSQSLEWLIGLEGTVASTALRSTAIDVIGQHAATDVVREHLVAVLRGASPDEVRASAAERLGQVGDRTSFDALTWTIHNDRSMKVRESAVEALGQMALPEATRTLAALARSKTEPMTLRRAAVEALGQKASQEAAAPLDDLIASHTSITTSDGKVTVTPSADGRGQNVDVYDANGRREVSIQQSGGQQKIVTHGDLRDGDGKDNDNDKDSDNDSDNDNDNHSEEAIQRQAVESLAQMPEEISLPRLIDIAHTHANQEVRRQAVEGLGQLGSDKAFAAVEQIAWSSDQEVARQAVSAISEFEPSKSRPRLIDLAHRHTNREVRRQAVSELGHLEPTPEVLRVLDDLVWKDGDQEVQRQAVSAIAELPSEQRLSRLEKIAGTHPREQVRRQAVEELADADPDQAVPILEKLIGQGEKNRR